MDACKFCQSECNNTLHNGVAPGILEDVGGGSERWLTGHYNWQNIQDECSSPSLYEGTSLLA